MTLDITKIDTAEQSETGYEFELLYAGQKTGAFVTIRGEKSKTVKEWNRRQYAKAQERELSARARGKQVQPMTAEELESFLLESAAARVISWRGVTKNGKDLECTHDNLIELLRRDDSFAEQIIEESKILANFIRG